MTGGKQDGLETLNQALLELGQRRARGELDADSYRAQCYHLLADLDDNGRGEPRDASPSVGIPRRTGVSPWFWLIPILLALVFLGGLAGILFWLVE